MTELLQLEPCAIPLDGITLIEASAGTGKTHTIATLFVRLLLEKGLTIAEILVVTYTKAATAELRQRIRQRLGQALETFDTFDTFDTKLDGGAAQATLDADLVTLAQRSIDRGRPRADRERLVTALNAFDEASIFTIHGFCQRVLTQSAFETNTGFDTELLENQRLLLDEVVHDYWATTLYDSSERFAAHVLAAFDPDDLSKLAQRVLGDPDLVVLPELSEAECDAALQACAPEAPAPDAAQLARALLAFKSRFVRYVRAELPRRKLAHGVQGFDDLLVRLRDAIDGPRGEQLIEQIRTRHPAALIDEFQDTDPVQCRVFERVYDPHAKAPLALFLIGDPKQAIYGFRGADVFAYMRAAEKSATRAFTLPVNHRSGPSLVRAVNTLFGTARAPFWFPEIRFQPVAPRPGARERFAIGSDARAACAALELLFVSRTKDTVGKKAGIINKGEALPMISKLVTREILQLLASGATIEGVRVKPRDIAVLCRTNSHARSVQAALRQRGVPAVLEGDDSVFDSELAEELDRLLAALCEPTAASRVRAALLTSMLGQTADDLLALEGEDDADRAWDGWLAAFHRWHELWESRGVVQALSALIDEQGVAERLLRLPDGERRLTDLTHLLELLHTQSRERRQGSFALAAWFRRMRSDSRLRLGMTAESAQIRLESDAHAVTLTTIHKSKGLDYPIVYCPFSWDGLLLRADDKKNLQFHDDTNAHLRTLDHDPQHVSHARHERLAKIEALAENLRLLYVALTRAKHRVTVVWGGFNDAHTSALGYLLHQDPTAAPAALASATAERIKGMNDAQLRAELAQLAAASEGSIGVREAELGRELGRYDAGDEGVLLREPASPRAPRDRVRASSFSQLAAGNKAMRHASVDDALDLDAADEGLAAPPASIESHAETNARIALADFPTGAVRGRLIHSIYEKIDFRAGAAAALEPEVVRALAGYGMESSSAGLLGEAIARTLITPIEPATGLPQLASLAPGDRLTELEFVFPVAHAAVSGTRPAPLRAQTLARVLERHARSAAEREYAAKVAGLGFHALHGYLRGFIDLVARHDGRYYVLDYKSNHLGPNAADYSHAPMQAAMFEHHYVLQYLIYSVAVDRHLSLRLPDYDYERCCGGVYYLFVRGMAPEHAPGTGVYRARPSRELIMDLSEALRDPAGAP